MLVKLEWLGYRMVKKLWRYVKPFSSDTGTLRMDGDGQICYINYNNNNNNHDNVYTMFMVLSSWQIHCERSPGSFDECRMAPSGRRPKTKPHDLGCESACTGCQKLHPPSPFIITQPESWYSFYRPKECRRLSRHNHQYRASVCWGAIKICTKSELLMT